MALGKAGKAKHKELKDNYDLSSDRAAALAQAGKAKHKELENVYDLSTERAAALALRIAKQADIEARADAIIAVEDLCLRAGSNGTPYQHPIIGIRNKAIELAVALEDKLQEVCSSKTDVKELFNLE